MFMKLFYEFHLRMWQTLYKNSLGTLHTWEMWHLLFQEKVCWCWVIFWVVSNTVFAKPIPRSLIVLQHVPSRRLLSLYQMNSDIGKLTFLSEVSSVCGNHTVSKKLKSYDPSTVLWRAFVIFVTFSAPSYPLKFSI